MVKKLLKKLIRSLFRRHYAHGGVLPGRRHLGGDGKILSMRGGTILCEDPYCDWESPYETEMHAMSLFQKHLIEDHYDK